MLRTFASFYRLTAVLACSLLLVAGCSDDNGDGPTNPPPSGDVDEKVRPVLFVHAENESAETWNVMAKWFLNNGHSMDQVYALDVRFNEETPGYVAAANQIKTEMDAIVGATGEGRVDIVAHGMGARGVQHYLTQLGGTERAAHVVFIGGLLDPSITLDGTMTPPPCEYMTVVSDGNDATQAGDATAGTISGVTNVQVPGADHQQLCVSSTAYAEIYEFFTADAPMHTDYPTATIGSPHEVHGRVLSFIDNEPIEGATVTILPLKWVGGQYGPQTPPVAYPVTTDADGRFSVETLTNDPAMYVRIEKNGTHYASRVYRQPYLKGPVMFDRYYMLPLSGGSEKLQAFRDGMEYSPNHSNVVLRTEHRALYHGRDELSAQFLVLAQSPDVPDSTIFGNATAFPPAGTGGEVRNVTTVALFDEGADQQNGSGPVADPGVKGYTISSYDLYFWSTNKGYTSGIDINGRRLYFQNWRSGDDDIVWLKFTDLE